MTQDDSIKAEPFAVHRTNSRQSVDKKSRIGLLKFFAIVFPFWLSAKFFQGPYMEFIHNYFSAILLIIMLSLAIQLIAPQLKAKTLLLCLFVLLSLVEILSTLMPAAFSAINLSIGGTTIIGGIFSVHMIPYYGVGGFIGYFILQACRNK